MESSCDDTIGLFAPDVDSALSAEVNEVWCKLGSLTLKYGRSIDVDPREEIRVRTLA